MIIEIQDTSEDQGRYGRIVIGDFFESFSLTLGPWSVSDYYKHWLATVQKALQGNDVCFVTDWNPTDHPEGISGMMWKLYWLDSDTCAMQNALLLNEIFDAQSPPDPLNITPNTRIVVNEDGDRISEWRTSRKDLLSLQNFLKEKI